MIARGLGRRPDDDTTARLRLLALKDMGPARLAWLLGQRDPLEVVETLVEGRLPDDLGTAPSGVNAAVVAGWKWSIRSVDIEPVLAANRELGIRTMSPHDADWPLSGDPEPPALLFVKGNVELLDATVSVAVVGTRRCTAVGRTVADRLGRELAAGGATVVSGLALGVDGAAHRGALGEGPAVIGVVGSGLDVVYPRANRALWDEVGERGLLVSESHTGAQPKRWRFPARNRLIAALSDAVVVVESHRRGGALSTADEAILRDRSVMAVPGSVLSSASEGTNALLVDGAIPVRDAADVLDYLGRPVPRLIGSPDRFLAGPEPGTSPDDPSPTSGSAGGVGARILAEVATGPVHLDDLVLVTGLTVADVLATVQELQAEGSVELDGSTVSAVAPR